MALMIIRHRVKDFADWKKVFDGHAGAQKGRRPDPIRRCSTQLATPARR
jgi:hypothetical protein